MASSGDKVRVVCEEEEVEGILLPGDEEHLVLKLDSGYNVGIDRDRIEEVEVLEQREREETDLEEVEQEKGDKPEITILHTGGTIASKVDYDTGAVIGQFEPAEILQMFPQLREVAAINARKLSNIQSEMMRFDHYNLMAEAVAEEREKGVDGVIITHGTDTMHYSSAALAFALPGLDIAVVFVGSQRSSDRPSTDARVNLLSAAKFIGESSHEGTAICMHENSSDDSCLVIPGCKARKMHTSRRDAFRPINATPLARVDIEEDEIEVFSESAAQESFEVKKFDTDLEIGMLQAHPHMQAEEVEKFEGFDGVVFQLMALGHAPNMDPDEYTDENARIAEAIQDLSDEIPVVACSQSLYGRLNLNVYTPQRKLLEQGVVGNHTDMTPETAFVKLGWLLSQYDDKEKVEELYEEDLRGEISERSEPDTFLI